MGELNFANYYLTYPYTVFMVKDSSGRLEYVCEAEPGTATSSALWRIRKLTYDSAGFNTNVQWASGDKNFNKIADNYSTYTYS